MINDVENSSSLNSVSDLEFDKNSLDMMRYKTNGLSYIFGLLAMVCSIFAAFICFNSMAVNTPVVLLKIFLNIVILLFGFLCCEKTKNYSAQSSVGLIVLGGVCIARIFFIPLLLIIDFTKYLNGKTTSWLGQTVLKTNYATRWLPDNGYFRAITAIVLLGLAAVMFIYAGVVGLKRTNKLTKYLHSIDQK